MRRQISRRAKKVRVVLAKNDQRMLQSQRFERRLRVLGLGLGQIQRFDHHQLAIERAIRNRQAQSLPPRLLRHLVRIIARLRSKDGSAMPPYRRSRRSRARASGALLPPRLFAATRDQSARLGRGGTGAPIRHLHPYRFVQQRLVSAAAENRSRQLKLAGALATRREQRHLDRIRSTLFQPPERPAALHPLAFASCATRRVFAACRTITSPPSAPGTHPDTMMRCRRAESRPPSD